MSSDFYFRKWKKTLVDLEALVNIDIYFQVKPCLNYLRVTIMFNKRKLGIYIFNTGLYRWREYESYIIIKFKS